MRSESPATLGKNLHQNQQVKNTTKSTNIYRAPATCQALFRILED